MEFVTLALIVLVVLIIVFSLRKEKLLDRKDVLPNKANVRARVFAGFWVYKSPDGSREEYLSVEATGPEELIVIRRMNKWRPVFPPIVPGGLTTFGHLKKSVEEPPMFRFIPIGPTLVQLISVNPTYSFPATNMELVETRDGPAILFQGKTYHETGVTF